MLLRLAAGGWLPARYFEPRLPAAGERSAREGRLRLEIVSHCWRYAHLLVYQLSSLARFPPQDLDVTMTVYFCEEDGATSTLLDLFGDIDVTNVHWNWRPIPRASLFRRAIGRNEAALSTDADWIWFTDCDLMLTEGCLDALADALQGRTQALCYPATEYCTPLLTDEHPLLNPNLSGPLPLDAVGTLDESDFTERRRDRATGPLQITHGDVARACGYCDALAFYQRPASTWQKAHEDRAFRWLLQTQGVPLQIPGVYRIRHAAKGRYSGNALLSWLRGRLRRLVSAWQEASR